MSRTLAIEPASHPAQERSMTGETDNLQEQIQLRAYELYVARGRADGHHEEDWYQAENKIRAEGHINKAA
jgi:hypothetical protein